MASRHQIRLGNRVEILNPTRSGKNVILPKERLIARVNHCLFGRIAAAVLAFSCVLSVGNTSLSAEIPPLNAVIKSVFRIQYSDKSGAAFAIEVDDRQYLITAKHVVPGITKDNQVTLNNSEDQVSIIRITPILCDNTNVDIIVLVPPNPLATPKRTPATQSGAALGQDVFVFGFPLGYYTSVERNIVPFVGKGMISAVDARDSSAVKYFFHTTAAPGFSGGPIVFIDQNDNAPKILGVISGFDTVDYPVYNGSVDTGLRAKVNPGIMFGYSIDAAIVAIRKQPIGPSIK